MAPYLNDNSVQLCDNSEHELVMTRLSLKNTEPAILCFALYCSQNKVETLRLGILGSLQPGSSLPSLPLGSHWAHDHRCWPVHSVSWAKAFLLHSFCKHVSTLPAIHLFLCNIYYKLSTGIRLLLRFILGGLTHILRLMSYCLLEFPSRIKSQWQLILIKLLSLFCPY